jgi:hypothetical protein
VAFVDPNLDNESAVGGLSDIALAARRHQSGRESGPGSRGSRRRISRRCRS